MQDLCVFMLQATQTTAFSLRNKTKKSNAFLLSDQEKTRHFLLFAQSSNLNVTVLMVLISDVNLDLWHSQNVSFLVSFILPFTFNTRLTIFFWHSYAIYISLKRFKVLPNRLRCMNYSITQYSRKLSGKVKLVFITQSVNTSNLCGKFLCLRHVPITLGTFMRMFLYLLIMPLSNTYSSLRTEVIWLHLCCASL